MNLRWLLTPVPRPAGAHSLIGWERATGHVTPQGVMGTWLAAGILAGIAAGWWLGNLWIGAFVGTAAGLALGAALSPRAPAEASDDNDDADPGGTQQVPQRVQIVEVQHVADDEDGRR